ncbi:right-handed parallel beta-helix repeat-containing protein [Methanosarcina sp.]|uniref:right-handed parallel beta-helix repeat-containing protein n=1 Tax=Methanosarcina sp. TaxID=2213 RepID=UPI003BB5A37E
MILYAVDLAKASDADLVEEMCKEGGVVNFEARTYTFDRSITLKSGDIILQGEKETTFKFADECGILQNVPMIAGTGIKNITFSDIWFEGNQERQTYALKYSNPNHPEQSGKKAYGNQIGTFIYLINCQNIKVTGCAFNDNLGDGLRCSGCKNIEVSYNTGEKGGHDTFFFLRSSYVSVHNNNIKTLVNSGCRLLSTSHARIYNNVFSWEGPRDAGPLNQYQNDKGVMEDIEICNNIFNHACCPGIWGVDKTGGNSEMWVHHNLFLDCGDNRISWVGGILSSGYNNLKIENNVFDGCYRASVVFFAVNSAWATAAEADLKANIFTNSRESQFDGQGPYGVENTISKQDVTSSYNCYYNNRAGNTYGCKVSDTDIFINPKEHETPSGWTWNGKEWSCPEVKPSEMDVPTGFSPLSDQEIEDADRAANEFDIIYKLLNLEYTDTAKTEYTSEDFDYKVIETERGKIAVKFKILGWNNLFTLNNQSYISSPDDIIVQSEVIKNPSLQDWFGGISKINKTVSVKIENGTATATMNVSVKWYNYERDSKTGAKQKGKIHISNYTFTDSCPAPLIWQESEEVKGIIYQYPDHFTLSVPNQGRFQYITYKFEENVSKHIFLVGVRNETETGIKYTEYSEIEHWEDTGYLTRFGAWIEMDGKYDPAKIQVITESPFNEFRVTDFDVIKKELPKKPIKWWFYPKLCFMGCLFIAIQFFRNRIKNL